MNKMMDNEEQFRQLKTIYKKGRYTSAGKGYYPHLREADQAQVSTGNVEITATDRVITQVFHGKVHGSMHQHIVRYVLGGTYESYSTKGSKHLGTWHVKDNAVNMYSTGKDDSGHVDKRKIIVSRIGKVVSTTNFVIARDNAKLGEEHIQHLAGAETMSAYNPQLGCSTSGLVKVSKLKNNRMRLVLPKKLDFLVAQKGSNEDATLNADDRDILNMDAGAFYDRHLKGSIGKKHQPTVFVSHSGDKKVALVLEAAALTTKGNLELVCRKIKQNQNGNQSDDLASEKQHLGISFDLAAVSKGYTSYKNPLWSGGQPSIACGIQEGVSVIEAHNKLADCLTAAAKKSN